MPKAHKKARQMRVAQGSNNDLIPLEIATGSPARRNASSTQERTDKFANIADGLVPSNLGKKNTSIISIKDAIGLSRKAYFNFSVIRNTVDLMTEFSTSHIFFRGGSTKSRALFETIFSKQTLWTLQDKFFREYYRSANVFLYRLDGELKTDDIRKIKQALAKETDAEKLEPKLKFPVKYILLNPEDIIVADSIVFHERPSFSKVLNSFELERLKKPQNQEERDMLAALPEKTQTEIKQGRGGEQVLLPLDNTKISAVFYKKQDYEPMAVPMIYPVLEDINWKSEMKKMDMAAARTMQQVILLINMGYESKDGKYIVNQKAVEAMQNLFKNESISRVLVADFTVKAQFVIPDIADLLDPAKYQIVDRDIREGLNNVLIGDEKFANQHIKVQIFMQRLEQARLAFLNDFLTPEIKRIAKDIGLKTYPEPTFEDIDLQDSLQYARIYTQLAQLGVLTPEECFKAIDSGKLPSNEESIESQKRFKELREDGLYQPLLGAPKEGDGAGRPDGTKAPQSTKNVSPIGTSKAISLAKVKDKLILYGALEDKIKAALLKKMKLKELNAEQLQLVDSLAELVVTNETSANWLSEFKPYLDNPVDKNMDRVAHIREIAAQHQTSMFEAAIIADCEK
jgi:hypothetical protein